MTKIFQVETEMGYPVVVWTDHLNAPRKIHSMFRRGEGGRFFAGSNLEPEHRPEIISLLTTLPWHETKSCLKTAPWLIENHENQTH